MPPRKKKETLKVEITDRQSKLDAIELLKTQMNTGTDTLIQSMNDVRRDVEVISTRIPSLDIATGVGGLPRGRVVEIYGPERAGKTTVALQACAVCQQQGGTVLYIDSEHALDAKYCEQLGLDVNDPGFIIIQTKVADAALDAAIKFLEIGVVDTVVIDSLANLVPQAVEDQVMEKGVGKALVGTKARLFTQFMELAIGRVHASNGLLIILQQMRTQMKPGMPPRETSASPLSVKHNTSVRIKVVRTGDNTQDSGIGNKTDETFAPESQESLAKVEKNKVGPPFRQALYTVRYGYGADYFTDLLECFTVHGLRNVAYSMKRFTIVDDNGEILGKFHANDAGTWLMANPLVLAYLVDKLSATVGIHLYDPSRPTKHVGPFTEEELAMNEHALVVATVEQITQDAAEAEAVMAEVGDSEDL